MSDLLLYSLNEFKDVFIELFKQVSPKSICEIGIEQGQFTDFLIDYGTQHNVFISGVDTQLSEKYKTLDSSKFQFIEQKSLEGIPNLSAADIYIIDGDHNYYTVFNELSLIHKLGHSPLIILHDVGWPSARRDSYYSPVTVPPEGINEYDLTKGVTYNSSELIDGGFRGNGAFFFSKKEGGEKNGVFTAVETFLDTQKGKYSLSKIEAIFGLGILIPEGKPWSKELRQFLKKYTENSLIPKLEKNRIQCYLKVIELQDLLEKQAITPFSESRLNDILKEDRQELFNQHRTETLFLKKLINQISSDVINNSESIRSLLESEIQLLKELIHQVSSETIKNSKDAYVSLESTLASNKQESQKFISEIKSDIEKQLEFTHSEVSTRLQEKYLELNTEITQLKEQVHNILLDLNKRNYLKYFEYNQDELLSKGLLTTIKPHLFSKKKEIFNHEKINYLDVKTTNNRLIQFSGKIDKIITSHPSFSYSINENNSLLILDYDIFTSQSEYLVVITQ